MNQQSTYARGITMSAFGMLILSPDGLLLRMVTNASSWDVIFYRGLFVGIAIGAWLILRWGSDFFRIIRGMGMIGILSTLLMAVSNLNFVGAINNTSVANTLVILATMPLFSALLCRVFIGESVKPRTWMSIGFAFLGMGVIFYGSIGGGTLLGDFLAAATAFFQGLNIVLLRKARDREIVMPALCLSGFIAAVFVLPLSSPMNVNSNDLAVLGLMGFIVVPISLALFLGGAKYAPAAEVALLSMIETTLGPLWVWMFIGEVPTIYSFIGGFIVICSLTVNAGLGIRESRRSRTASSRPREST